MRLSAKRTAFFLLGCILSLGISQASPTYKEIQERLDSDVSNDRPLVVHLIVPLCDNKYQGILSVPAHLGDGQSPRENLYWGAMYGVRSFLTHKAGWSQIDFRAEPVDGLLESILLTDWVKRGADSVRIYILAEAWDGAKMRPAVDRFLTFASGRKAVDIKVGAENDSFTLEAGGKAHLVIFAGHNGLMDFGLSKNYDHRDGSPVKAAAVLCCFSRDYFSERLARAGSYPLLMTTGLMAPEAYTIDALVRNWASGASPNETREAAARAYDRYQKCGLRAARHLFSATQ